jgi:hypothetical protein
MVRIHLLPPPSPPATNNDFSLISCGFHRCQPFSRVVLPCASRLLLAFPDRRLESTHKAYKTFPVDRVRPVGPCTLSVRFPGLDALALDLRSVRNALSRSPFAPRGTFPGRVASRTYPVTLERVLAGQVAHGGRGRSHATHGVLEVGAESLPPVFRGSPQFVPRIGSVRLNPSRGSGGNQGA